MKRTVVIIGATGGIGHAVARRFAMEKVNLVLVGRSKTKLSSLKNELEQYTACDVYSVHIERYESVKKLAAIILKKYKQVDVLVNSAGVMGPAGLFHTLNFKDIKQAIDIDLLGTVHACHAFLPHMVLQRSGSIINLSGGGATSSFLNFSPYAASKAAVVRFTETIAEEYKAYNIYINAVAPGMINTKFITDALKAGKKRVGEAYYKKLLEVKKSGGDDPALAAELIYFLADAKNTLTGKLISAKWDPWKQWTKKDMQILNQQSSFTLRRIDNKYFYEK